MRKFNKTMHKNKTIWLTGACGQTLLVVTPAASPETAGDTAGVTTRGVLFKEPYICVNLALD